MSVVENLQGPPNDVESLPPAAALTSVEIAESQSRTMIDAIPAIVWKTTPDGSNSFHNQRLLEYTGFSRDEALGAGWASMIHPEDVARHYAAWVKAVEAGATFEVESRLRRFDGEYRWFLARAEPRRDLAGNIYEWYGTNIDIHDRRMAEQALQRSEAYLSEALRLNRTGTFGWNASTGEIFYWSDAVYEIFEFDPPEIPVLASVLKRFHPDDLPSVLGNIQMAPQKGSYDFRARILTPSGVLRHVHITAHLAPDNASDLHFLGAISDITEKVKNDELLIRLQADFAHASRVSLLGELTASIAHEIAQPLSAIAASGEAGLRWLDREDPDLIELKTLTERIVSNARRANDIIGRVRSMATRAAPAREMLDLDETVRECLIFLRHEVHARNTQLLHHPAVEKVCVHADRTQLQQVVVNLVMNAMQALQDGSSRSVVIRTDLLEQKQVTIVVEDTGTGICAEHLPRLFESFFSTKPDGMGIGLQLCKSIVEAHGGRIQAENRPDMPGARVTFTLPLAAV